MKTALPRLLFSTALGIALVSSGQAAPAKSGKVSIETVEPAQLTRGAVTAVVVQGIGLEKIDAVEVTPSDGITVAEITPAVSPKRKQQRWTIRLQVAPEAALGDRSMVIATPLGRSSPVKLFIPSHVPRVSSAQLMITKGSPVVLAFTVDVSDEAGDLGDDPSLETHLIGANTAYAYTCNGVITEKSGGQNYVVAGAIQDSSRTATGKLMLQIRVKDRNGFTSDWLSVPVTFN